VYDPWNPSEKNVIRYIGKIAARYKPLLGGGDGLHVLISEGYIGYRIAMQKYDPTRGVYPLAYAKHWILARIRDYIKKERKPCGLTGELTDKMLPLYCYDEADADIEDNPSQGASPEQKLLMASYDDTEDRLIARDDAERIRRRVSRLPGRLQSMVFGRFWDGRTLRDIGHGMGLSAERIRQLETKAFKIIREMEDDYVDELTGNVIIDTIRALRDGGSIAKAAELLKVSDNVVRYRISREKAIEDTAVEYAGFKPRKKKAAEEKSTSGTDIGAGPAGASGTEPAEARGGQAPALSEEEFRELGGHHISHISLPGPTVKVTIEIMCPMDKIPEIMEIVKDAQK
jgi:RNA polymerase sigma factor (sigma-70 family)